MATQNPKGSAGTQLLPESQLDRFMICMSMGYPDLKSEVEIARGKSVENGPGQVRQVISSQDLMGLRRCVEEVYVKEAVYTYIAKLCRATRENPYIELGLSPRGTIACTRMAKAWAFLQGRDYVLPEDVAGIYTDVARHRIVLNTKARVTRVSEEAVLAEILSEVKPPASYMKNREYGG